MTTEYTGKERVLAAIKSERLDRVPISFHVPKTHEFGGYTAMECVMDPDKALEAQIKVREVYPSDIVNVPGDPYLPTTMTAIASPAAINGPPRATTAPPTAAPKTHKSASAPAATQGLAEKKKRSHLLGSQFAMIQV